MLWWVSLFISISVGWCVRIVFRFIFSSVMCWYLYCFSGICGSLFSSVEVLVCLWVFISLIIMFML